jgi:hypothetical protein
VNDDAKGTRRKKESKMIQKNRTSGNETRVPLVAYMKEDEWGLRKGGPNSA